ncbi:xylulokinase/glycerol kinase [Ruminiclostridium sufflavum DSM 19573]|uniref:Xylulokinase/glycerol kinase n=1 Tax=Ruminiclostridium sufflavum DSM 19573 TaxID=1121337 RepID=A0A318XRJ3_9FIRM|nr:FGGY-family carbohydrate kinase [Ruminiclostridium sufflavum]PYG90279.1 xylulokinase/glycerol kinase [Ruminiclostridium sufflavum DSM 19573]
MKSILVIDIGTSSMRGIIYNENGSSVKTVQRFYSPDYISDSCVEQDALVWKNSLLQIISECIRLAADFKYEITAVSLTSQRSSVIPVDRDGNPLSKAIMWQDKRAAGICNEFSKNNDTVYIRTGTRLNPIFAGPKITWLRRNKPDIYKASHKIIVIPDYIIFLMTGLFVTDYTYGSRTSLMNIHTLQWDQEMLSLFEIDEAKLCRLIPQGQILGVTTEAFEAQTGLRSGTPVISAGGDQQCGALGAGIMEEGSLQVTTGTGSYIAASSDKVVLDSRQGFICNVSAVQNKYILESAIPASSSVYNWFYGNFYQNAHGIAEMKDTIDIDVSKSPCGANGVIMLPHFQGRGSPDWNPLAKGMFFNITLATKREDLARSILEGIAAEIAENIEIMRNSIGKIDKIFASGGMTKFKVFNQIQADLYNCEVILPDNKESTALGAWVSSAVSLGLQPSYRTALDKANERSYTCSFSPVSENAALYRKMNPIRQKLYRAILQENIYTDVSGLNH